MKVKKPNKMMKVEYIGKLDFIAEFNGKRYAFSKRNRVMEMPPEAFAYILANSGFKSDQLIPHTEDTSALKESVLSLEKSNRDLLLTNEKAAEKINSLEKEISVLKKENEKLKKLKVKK